MQHVDDDIVQLLVKRDGIPTVVKLRDGRSLAVIDIAWGYDEGHEYAHVTTNVSPGNNAMQVDLFFTSEVSAVLDPSNGSELWRSHE
jgi:hypothetical protein